MGDICQEEYANQIGEIQFSMFFGLDCIYNGASQSLLMQAIGEFAYWYDMKEFKLACKGNHTMQNSYTFIFHMH